MERLPLCRFPAGDCVVSADAIPTGALKTDWGPRPLAKEPTMPAQPHPSNEPHQAPRGPDGRLAAWAETAVLLAGLVSGAALVATILLLLILI
jgi:hypothetical protein